MAFELNGQATLEKLNVRKEGPTEDKHLALDLKLAIRTDADILLHFHPTLKHFLFTDEGDPRIAILKPLAIEGRMRHMELEIGGFCFRGVDIDRFKIHTGSDFGITLQFVASLSPDGTQTAQLAEFVGDELKVEIRPEPELDLRPPMEAPPAPIKPAQPGKAKRYMTNAAIKYRHPDNEQLVWTGRGNPPAWAKALMDAGRGLDCIEVPA